MTAYTQLTDFASKDALLTGNPLKIVKGTEIDAEFAAIEAADADNVKTSGLGTNVATFLASPTRSNMLATITGYTDVGVTVFDYMSAAEIADVKAGAFTLNVSAAFASAIATGKPVYVPAGPGWIYRIGTTISVPSSTTILSDGAKLKLANTVNNHVFRIANGADNVEIRGLAIDGNKSNNTGGSGIAMGGTGGTRIRIKNNYIKSCSAHGVYTAGSSACTEILVADNFCYDNYSGGVTADDTTEKFAYERNVCWGNGTHGVGIVGIAKHGAIVGNVCYDNGQGTPNADNITGYNVANEDITVTGNTCYGGLNNGIHMGGSLITISSNVVHNPAQYGIYSGPSSGVADDLVVNGNTVYSAGAAGMWIKDCNSGAVSGNVIRTSAGSGISIDNCQNVAFTGNTIRSNSGDGIFASTASTYLSITGNTVVLNGADGIDLAGVTKSTITGNVIQTNTGYGINVSGTEGSNIISSNICRGNTAGQIAQPAVTTKVIGNDTNTSRNVASAATVTLPAGGEYFYITGTTGITSITTSFAERRVTLQFDDVLTITEGSNLKMAGNFTTSFTDTITFICDGTNWIECCRSNN